MPTMAAATASVAAAGTPAELNRVGILKVGSPRARNVLVLNPGTSASAAYFRPLAEAIVARLQAAQADAAALVAGEVGALRVGTYQSVGERILPTLVSRLRASHPGVEVGLVESESDDELLAAVERGELDLAFALLPLPDGPFASLELMRDPWMLLVRADSPLVARDRPVSLGEAARLPLIGARLQRCRMQVDAHFRARGLKPNYAPTRTAPSTGSSPLAWASGLSRGWPSTHATNASSHSGSARR
jgi:DNA-binding transcriptional LysR family regulator